MKIKCLAVDDEPFALRQMSDYIQKTSFLELSGSCNNAFEAMKIMSSTAIEVIFIDINMPELSGMEFVKSLIDKPFIVFTTAYAEYAVEGFKVDAVDYLLKPISYAHFLNAATKAKNRLELISANQTIESEATEDYMFVKSDYKLIRINLNDILYIESQHEYIKIYLTENKTVMTQLSMKTIEEQLPQLNFMRVHRSYIVNLDKINLIERNLIVFGGNVFIPISEQYREKFNEYVDKYIIGRNKI
ncbi:MAG: LytTR family DNA-binding domain-containing protein [Bacteroidota bacterium]